MTSIDSFSLRTTYGQPRPSAPAARQEATPRTFGYDMQDGFVGQARTPKPKPAWTPSKYWKSAGKEMDVDIDGYDFDFNPKTNVGKEKVEGEVDGPLNHNGGYRVTKNRNGELELEINVGTNKAQDNDLDVKVSISGGKATLTGTVKGKSLGSGVSAKVTGSGTKRDPFTAKFVTAQGKTHTIKWRPD